MNGNGHIAVEEWLKTAVLRPNVLLDEFIVMPNQVHGIVILNSERSSTARRATTEKFGKPIADSIPTIVRAYKSAVTKQIHTLKAASDYPVWQRNYYEHVIRGEDDLNSIREYIRFNPQKWSEDEENPLNHRSKALS